MNDLQRYFEENTGNQISKWMHYFEIYDRYFSRFRGTDVHILEVGVAHGGSLQMWRKYFGSNARIYGADANPDCRRFASDQVQVFIGDQGDKAFLRRLAAEIPRIDILIDDGGHTMEQQISTLEVMYPHVACDGVYICEDLHTSYWRAYGGGYKRRGSFIEYSKHFIDYLHLWHSDEVARQGVEAFTKSTYALHYYDSMLVIEKKPVNKPYDLATGRSVLVEPPMVVPPLWKRAARRVKQRCRDLLTYRPPHAVDWSGSRQPQH